MGRRLKVEAVYNWILYPHDFSQVTSPAQFTIGSFVVKKVIEGEYMEGSSLVAKGILVPNEQSYCGVLFELDGDYVTETNGKSALVVTHCTPATPTNKRETIAFLSCGILKGVGKKTAEKMYCEFGEKVIEIIDKEPDKLIVVPGISKARAKVIAESFKAKGANVMDAEIAVYLHTDMVIGDIISALSRRPEYREILKSLSYYI